MQIETMYKNAHNGIRLDPEHVAPEKKEVTKKRWNRVKMTLSERKNRIAQKKASFIKKLEDGQPEV